MEQTKTSDRDFLDVLRELNSGNINDDPARRDAFFDSLMTCDFGVPSYLKSLSDAYFNEFFKEYNDKGVPEVVTNYLVAEIFNKNISSELGSWNAVEDRNKMLFIKDIDSAYVLPYVGSIKGMRKIIESAPIHFDFFKETLLWGLLRRYARKVCDPWISGNEYKERFNKLIVLLAEHIKKLSPFEEIPYVLDEQFMEAIRTSIKENNRYLTRGDCFTLVHRFFDRVPIFNMNERGLARDEYVGRLDLTDDLDLEEDLGFEEDEPIFEVSPPKSKSSLKTNLLRGVSAVLAAAAVWALSFNVKKNINVVPPLDNEPTVGVSVPISTQPNPGIDDITDNENDDIKDDDIKDDDIKDDDDEQIVSEVPSLWDTVIMNSDEIYSDMYSAANKENPLKAYFGAETEYTIIGVVLSKGEGLKMVNISTPDGQGLIDALLADGFKCVAYSITVMGNELNKNNLLYNPNMVTGFVPSDGVSLIVGNNLSIVR